MRIKRSHISELDLSKELATDADVMEEDEMINKFDEVLEATKTEDAQGASVCEILRDYGLEALQDLNLPTMTALACLGSAEAGRYTGPSSLDNLATDDVKPRMTSGFQLRSHQLEEAAFKPKKKNGWSAGGVTGGISSF